MRLETNLYDVETGELVWSGHSKTFNPRSLKEELKTIIIDKNQKVLGSAGKASEIFG